MALCPSKSTSVEFNLATASPLQPKAEDPESEKLGTEVVSDKERERQLMDAAKRRGIVFTLGTLPSFNYTLIASFLKVSERLLLFNLICKRFYTLVLQPHCFVDMSFFPLLDDSAFAPKILAVTHTVGITYVEVNVKSQHPFVQRVAAVAGMWNFKAEVWSQLQWPTKLCIESLQLTLENDALPPGAELRLDKAPECLELWKRQEKERIAEECRQRLRRVQRKMERRRLSRNRGLKMEDNLADESDGTETTDESMESWLSERFSEISTSTATLSSATASAQSSDDLESDASMIAHRKLDEVLHPSSQRPMEDLLDGNQSAIGGTEQSETADVSGMEIPPPLPLMRATAVALYDADGDAVMAENCKSQTRSSGQFENSNKSEETHLEKWPLANKAISKAAMTKATEKACFRSLALRRLEHLKAEFQIRNLFFIRFDTPLADALSAIGSQQPFDRRSDNGPVIYFPRTLHGLGLQSFGQSVFANQWWATQLTVERRFEQLRFLVLSQCSFGRGQLQAVLSGVNALEHLSLRFVSWQGTARLPSTLLSVGFFPNADDAHRYDLSQCSKLFQAQTRLNENCGAAVRFVNAVSELPSVERVSFEFVRQSQRWLPQMDLSQATQWKTEKRSAKVCVHINTDDATLKTQVVDAFFPKIAVSQLSSEPFDFFECPNWSPEAKEFIQMTKNRKLLLR